MPVLQLRGIPVKCENGIFTIRIRKVQKNDNFIKFSLSDRLLETAYKEGAAVRVFFDQLGYSVCKPAKEWRRIVLFTEKVPSKFQGLPAWRRHWFQLPYTKEQDTGPELEAAQQLSLPI